MSEHNDIGSLVINAAILWVVVVGMTGETETLFLNPEPVLCPCQALLTATFLNQDPYALQGYSKGTTGEKHITGGGSSN